MIVNNEWNIIKSQIQSTFNSTRDELAFSASDNDDAPDEPILLEIECDMIIINKWNIIKSPVKFRFNWVRDELIFSASDNDDAPDEPILF